MEDNTFKKACRRGFTLIELMIVIVILGVLMGTILPRLTGAQARARDTGRIADLNTISQALETYYDDYGKYPGTQDTAYCLDTAYETDCSTGDNKWLCSLADYLKGGEIPTPPTNKQVSSYTATPSTPGTATITAPCLGTYLYIPLRNRGLSNNGYALISDVETFQNANVDLTTAAITGLNETSATVQNFGGKIGDVTAENAASAFNTVYMVVN